MLPQTLAGGLAGAGFCLLLSISPLLAGLFVLALPRLNDAPLRLETHTQLEAHTPLKTDTVFEPDAVLAGIPYRITQSGIEAMTKGGLVRFHNMDQFRAVAEGRDAPPVKPDFQDEIDGVRYKLNPDTTVTAMTPAGLQTYASWASFRQATKTGH